MRTTPTCTYEPPDIIKSAWVINFWLIDANTLVWSPLMNTSVNTLKPNIVTTQLEANEAIKTSNKYLSAATDMIVEKKERKKSLTRGHVKDIGSTVGIQSCP